MITVLVYIFRFCLYKLCVFIVWIASSFYKMGQLCCGSSHNKERELRNRIERLEQDFLFRRRLDSSDFEKFQKQYKDFKDAITNSKLSASDVTNLKKQLDEIKNRYVKHFEEFTRQKPPQSADYKNYNSNENQNRTININNSSAKGSHSSSSSPKKNSSEISSHGQINKIQNYGSTTLPIQTKKEFKEIREHSENTHKNTFSEFPDIYRAENEKDKLSVKKFSGCSKSKENLNCYSLDTSINRLNRDNRNLKHSPKIGTQTNRPYVGDFTKHEEVIYESVTTTKPLKENQLKMETAAQRISKSLINNNNGFTEKTELSKTTMIQTDSLSSNTDRYRNTKQEGSSFVSIILTEATDNVLSKDKLKNQNISSDMSQINCTNNPSSYYNSALLSSTIDNSQKNNTSQSLDNFNANSSITTEAGYGINKQTDAKTLQQEEFLESELTDIRPTNIFTLKNRDFCDDTYLHPIPPHTNNHDQVNKPTANDIQKSKQPLNLSSSNGYKPDEEIKLSSYSSEQDLKMEDNTVLADTKIEDRPSEEIFDVNQFFSDDLDWKSLVSMSDKEKIYTIDKHASTFKSKVEEFQGEEYSLEYFVLDEKLMRLIENLDKIKCYEDKELVEEKIRVIKYINNLHDILDKRSKDNTK